MGIHSTVLIKTDATPATVADTISIAFVGDRKREQAESSQIILTDNFSVAVVRNSFDDDGDIRFSYYDIAVIIMSCSNDHSTHRHECLSMGSRVLKIVISQMNSPSILVVGVQELIDSFQP